MSQEKPLNPNQITSLHLYDLAHSNAISPLSQNYSVLFERHNLIKQINLPPLLTYKFCQGCGNLWIPGLTVSIRIAYPKKKKGENVGKRRLRYRCTVCRHTSYDDSLIQEKNKKVEEPVGEKVEFKAEWTPDHTNQVKQPSVKNVKSKDRAKKRKLNLSSLLSEKKKQKTETKSLNLMDFLK
ncbi:uncharacterized protein SPAPADRAFT_55584 [Spathaspora passalidarum NRRL Y-27907]|uniref:Rpr2-domain-containing protein n=1 Tax=Spathaspora passalidarum (strain NRRL Y-27907 / 11-Y1) TaxID=619300 RepID=G3ANU3_SPAPN|nr:uncharacterized protein SPAPADRAFT_55584 [Spathaspora passalidarum NRRL Y-27907]EGW32029.1 hypothetical protein SPAPADRAFT_55584 [Spathaspora passalidarum NRRL Y-27907]